MRNGGRGRTEEDKERRRRRNGVEGGTQEWRKKKNGEGETAENGENGGKGRNEIREAVYTKCKSVKECSARVINVHVKLRDCVLYSICMFC